MAGSFFPDGFCQKTAQNVMTHEHVWQFQYHFPSALYTGVKKWRISQLQALWLILSMVSGTSCISISIKKPSDPVMLQ